MVIARANDQMELTCDAIVATKICHSFVPNLTVTKN
jgi:hypothetical protein